MSRLANGPTGARTRQPLEEEREMRGIKASAAAALAGAIGVGVVTGTGVASPAGAAQPGLAASAQQVASTPGSGQLVVDWTNELLQIEKTPGLQPATVHPTRSFAILDAAIEDARSEEH